MEQCLGRGGRPEQLGLSTAAGGRRLGGQARPHVCCTRCCMDAAATPAALLHPGLRPLLAAAPGLALLRSSSATSSTLVGRLAVANLTQAVSAAHGLNVLPRAPGDPDQDAPS